MKQASLVYLFQLIAIILSFAIGISGENAFGYAVSEQELLEEYPGESKWASEVFPGYNEFGIEWLESLIKENRVSSVEQLLPLLPRGLRRSYTLIKETRSLQDADEANPRVIMFAPDARFVLAFNGASYQRRYQQLEILDFTAEDGSARFFEVDFSSGEAKTSDVNPAVCMKCHASYPRPAGDAKPIWTNYSRWFGAYGENDDRLSKSEGELLADFFQKAETHPRYKWLLRDNDKSHSAPYYRSQSYDPEDAQRGHADRYMDNGVELRLRNLMFMPNIRLSKSLDARNAVRIAKKIERTQLYKDFPLTTLFSLACDNKGRLAHLRNDTDLLPENLPSFISLDFDIDPNEFTLLFADFRGDYTNGNHYFSTSAMVTGYFAKKLLRDSADPRLQSWYRPSFWRDYYGSFGISSRTEAQKTETYKYMWSWGYLMDSLVTGFSQTSFSGVPKRDVGVDPDAAGSSYDNFCGELAERVKSEVDGREDKINFALSYRGKFIEAFYGQRTVDGRGERSLDVILNECSDCHDSSDPTVDFAPYIPFADSSALAFMLKAEQRGEVNRLIEKVKNRIDGSRKPAHVGGGQMPLGRRELSEQEAESLLKYIEGLN